MISKSAKIPKGPKKRKKAKKRKLKSKIVKTTPKKVVVHEKDEKIGYRIIITSQNKIMLCVYNTPNKKNALTAFNTILVENNKKVRFPVRYSSRDHKLIPSKYELLLMKTKNDDESLEPLLRNEFGKLVPHATNSTKMIIYKKEEYLFEETFWVYGMNPKFQRKDFNYILNEFVLSELPDVKYPVKRVVIYRNKLIIEDDSDFEMIICKCINDAARLYTELEKEINKLKLKSVFFGGIAMGPTKDRLEDKIREKTGWNEKKIRRDSTRP